MLYMHTFIHTFHKQKLLTIGYMHSWLWVRYKDIFLSLLWSADENRLILSS